MPTRYCRLRLTLKLIHINETSTYEPETKKNSLPSIHSDCTYTFSNMLGGEYFPYPRTIGFISFFNYALSLDGRH